MYLLTGNRFTHVSPKYRIIFLLLSISKYNRELMVTKIDNFFQLTLIRKRFRLFNIFRHQLFDMSEDEPS